MQFFDKSLAELEVYRSADAEPADFDAFWSATLAQARSFDLNPEFVPVDAGLPGVAVWDVTFSGYGGQRIKAWYLRPAGVDRPIPALAQYLGYGGGRGYPHNWILWPVAGYATLVMDTRGQGSGWRAGDTPDIPDGANPAYSGMMTQGILSRDSYYYRRLYVDAVRALETVLARSDVDRNRVAVTGKSQGGGLSIAVAGLMPEAVALCMPEVPFLCNFRRAVGLTDANPYQEIVRYLKTHPQKAEQVFSTLDYFDGVFLARRVQAPVLCSTALMDDICPPSTVYAAYNELSVSDKRIVTYRFNGHDGADDEQKRQQLAELAQRWPVVQAPAG